jgi:hypothetical protein
MTEKTKKQDMIHDMYITCLTRKNNATANRYLVVVICACDANATAGSDNGKWSPQSQTWKPLWFFLILRIATRMTGKLHI